MHPTPYRRSSCWRSKIKVRAARVISLPPHPFGVHSIASSLILCVGDLEVMLHGGGGHACICGTLLAIYKKLLRNTGLLDFTSKGLPAICDCYRHDPNRLAGVMRQALHGSEVV